MALDAATLVPTTEKLQLPQCAPPLMLPGMELLTEPDTQLVPYGSRPSHLLGRSGLQLRSTMELLPGLGKLAVDGARRLGA